MRILAADIGGTNARFGFFFIETTASPMPDVVPVGKHDYKCDDFRSFNELIQAAKDDAQALGMESGIDVDIVAIAAAGAVTNDVCPLANRPWVIKKHELQATFAGAQVYLVNDFVAQGYAALLPSLLPPQPIHEGTPIAHAPIAVVGPGTGFGKALVLPAPFMTILPSEGGHAEFPFIGKDEYAFAEFARQRLGVHHLIGDFIVSGTGLELLYAFHTGKEAQAAQVAGYLKETPVVLDWFARFMGRFCRDYVLDTLALGGLVVTGGVAAKIPVLKHPLFLETLRDSVVHRHLLENLPVSHLSYLHAGVFGAALAGWHSHTLG